MKKRRIAITLLVVLLLLAGLALGAWKSSVPDIQLVNSVPAIYTLYSRYPKGSPYTVYRIYDVHVPYDQAVMNVMNDPRTKGWRNTEMDFFRSVFESPDQMQHVYVAREYMLAVPVAASASSLSLRDRDAIIRQSIDPLPDPHGWVTVTTDGTLSAPIGILKFWGQKLSSKLHPQQRCFANYGVLPKGGQPGRSVDVTKGTVQMEGEAASVRGFMTADD